MREWLSSIPPQSEIDSMFRPGGSAARSHGHRAQEPVGTPPPGGSTVGTTPDGRLLVQAADASGGGAGEPSVVVGVPACFPLMAPLEGAASRTARHRDDEAELQLALRLLPRVFEELQRDIDAGLCTGAQVSCVIAGQRQLNLWVGNVREKVRR
jgi:hypothetical protein